MLKLCIAMTDIIYSHPDWHKTYIYCRTVNYAHSSKVWCQMNQWFQINIILKCSPIGFMVNLALESTWISNGHTKKSNFVRDHSMIMIIYVLFGFNQCSGFWEKEKKIIFPFGPMLKICLVLVTNLDLVTRKKDKLYRGPYKKHFFY